jgi:DNA-binding response OmpR family regulator
VYYILVEAMSKKVLYINNIAALSMIPEFLARAGYGVDTAQDFDGGLRQLDAQAYDMAILLESPCTESWQLCEKLRKLTAIPLIVISSNASAETCVKAISAGADYFMRKPFGPLELVARINSLFQRLPSRQAVPLGS